MLTPGVPGCLSCAGVIEAETCRDGVVIPPRAPGVAGAPCGVLKPLIAGVEKPPLGVAGAPCGVARPPGVIADISFWYSVGVGAAIVGVLRPVVTFERLAQFPSNAFACASSSASRTLRPRRSFFKAQRCFQSSLNSLRHLVEFRQPVDLNHFIIVLRLSNGCPHNR